MILKEHAITYTCAACLIILIYRRTKSAMNYNGTHACKIQRHTIDDVHIRRNYLGDIRFDSICAKGIARCIISFSYELQNVPVLTMGV